MKMNINKILQILLPTPSVMLLLTASALSLENKKGEAQSLPVLIGEKKIERKVDRSWYDLVNRSRERKMLAQATMVEITEVRANKTETGIEIILITPQGESIQAETINENNSAIATIPNARLSEEFQQTQPIEGISEIKVTQSEPDRVQVRITGETNLPVTTIKQSNDGLIVGVTPPEQELEIVVTGEREQDTYNIPNATTATRTDTPIRDIPQSIQIVPQQVLEDQNAVRLRDALRNVSGVFVGNTFGNTSDNFIIRGFESSTILRDGFKESFLQSDLSFDLGDVEQVEVLKGPASVVYGYVEPGGAINLVTKKPLDNPLYNVDLSIGSYDFYRPNIDFSGPLTSDKALRYRLNLAYQSADSFRDFVDGERVFAAPVFDFKIGDRTNLSVNTNYFYDRSTVDRGIVAIGDGVADLPIDRFLGEPDDFKRIEQFSIGYRLEHKFNDNLKIRNGFQYLQNNESIFNTNAAELDEETGNLFRDYFDSENKYKIYAMQTDLTSEFKTGSIEHQLLFGFDLQRNTIDGFFRTPSDAFDTSIEDRQTPSINIFDPIYNVSSPDLSSFIFSRDDLTTTDSLGIFLQDLIAFTDNLKFLIGGRFDTITQKLDDDLNDSESSESNNAFSPRVGLVYQPIKPVSLYAIYSRSFAPNTGIGEDGSLLEPTKGTQYEVGIRNEFNSSLSATLAAYEITKTNIETTNPEDPAFSIAVGEQRSRGIELDVLGKISPGWNVIGSYSYTNAEITESNEFSSGNKVANVPRNKASLWTTYEFQKGSLQGLGLGLGLFYVDSRQGDLDNSFELADYTRTDAAIYYKRNNWRAGINIQNLFDIRYFETGEIGRTTVIPGTPLTVVGSFNIDL
jgi:iron complex outermembrane recepter protein